MDSHRNVRDVVEGFDKVTRQQKLFLVFSFKWWSFSLQGMSYCLLKDDLSCCKWMPLVSLPDASENRKLRSITSNKPKASVIKRFKYFHQQVIPLSYYLIINMELTFLLYQTLHDLYLHYIPIPLISLA